MTTGQRREVQVLRVGGKEFAVNLAWYSATRATSQEAREMAGDARLVCLRPGNTPQVGLADTGPVGLPSLACAAAAERPGTWARLVLLGPDRAWLVVCQSGYIHPDGDSIGDPRDLREQLVSIIGTDDQWADTEEVTLDVFAELAKSKRVPKVQPLTGGDRLKALPWGRMGIIGVTGLALLLGAHLYFSYAKERAAERARAVIEAQTQLARHAQRQLANRPWMTRPRPSIWLAACKEAFQATPYSIYGWRLAAWDCEGDRTSAQYVRTEGATALLAPGGTLDAKGDKIEVIGRLPSLPGDPSDPAADAAAQLYGSFQAAGLHLQIAHAKVLPGMVATVGQARPDQIEITGTLSPFAFRSLFDVPGVRLSRVALRLDAGRQWVADGDLYAPSPTH